MGNPTLSVAGVDEHDIRRGFKAASFVIGKALKKECSVYLEGFAIIGIGIDEDCDDDGLELSVVLDTDMDGDGRADLSSYQRFVDNAFGNFIPKAVEAQDYNSSRSNKSRASRVDVITSSFDVLRGHEKDFVDILKGNSDGRELVNMMSEQMAVYEYDSKFTALIFSEFINSLKDIYSQEEKAKKLASLDQSERLYRRIAKLSNIPVDLLKEIMKTATSITRDEIASGSVVELPEIGSVAVDLGEITVDTSARVGKSRPQTGKEIKIAAKRVAKFKAGKALAETVK